MRDIKKIVRALILFVMACAMVFAISVLFAGHKDRDISNCLKEKTEIGLANDSLTIVIKNQLSNIQSLQKEITTLAGKADSFKKVLIKERNFVSKYFVTKKQYDKVKKAIIEQSMELSEKDSLLVYLTELYNNENK